MRPICDTGLGTRAQQRQIRRSQGILRACVRNVLGGLAMSASDNPKPVAETATGDQADDLTGRTLKSRIRQQELLAELGVLALHGTTSSACSITPHA